MEMYYEHTMTLRTWVRDNIKP